MARHQLCIIIIIIIIIIGKPFNWKQTTIPYHIQTHGGILQCIFYMRVLRAMKYIKYSRLNGVFSP